ncbi:MAG: hypothetical protein V1775_17105 [Bacteroidota bacterium]
MTVQTETKQLRFAVMCNSMMVQRWQADVLSSLIDSRKATPVLFILRKQGSPEHRGILNRMYNYPWTKLLFRKYYRYFFRPDTFKPADISELASVVPRISCRVETRKKYSEYFADDDVRDILEHKPDFILKFGFGIIRGSILQAAPFGIWSFHHGDEQKFRGIPPAFYEILFNDRITGAVLQRLTETLDGGIILRKGYFRTINHSWKANLEQAISLSITWPADVCSEIIAQHTFPSETDSVMVQAPIYREPTNFTFSVFLVRQVFNKIKFHLRELLFAEKWQTGLVKARPADLVSDYTCTIDDADVLWLGANEHERYFADGFALKEESRLLLVFEDYNYKTRKAVLSSSWFTERESLFTRPVQVLEEPWHLSYPFLFRSEGQTWCMPESLNHGAIELYRFDSLTGNMIHHRTLVKGLAAADPTLVFHQNHWFLFFTPSHATNVELHIWHSDTLESPFKPHELNPVKADIANARPAGPFFTLDGKLYRPAQDCSQTYGGRVVINEVKLLTESEFLEMPVTYLKPPAGYSGLHTLSFAGDFLYFDCKRSVFSVSSAIWQMKRRLRLVKPNHPGGQ